MSRAQNEEKALFEGEIKYRFANARSWKSYIFLQKVKIFNIFDKMKGAIKSRQLEDHRRPENHLVYSSNSAF